ncbi:hypothetical protein [Clostridium peptidivorans]|uniref:hypothetical protein n=1 Tax=Clostridium peptidivorans TaxID=100174 RepID=UPI000BE4167D|nr:hypothetical protein [Clostridium peptidivorans]
MNYGEIELIVKELIMLEEDEYSDYTKQMIEFVNAKVNKEYTKDLFTYYDKEDLKLDIYLKVYNLLNKTEPKSLVEMLCYSKAAVNNFIKNKKRALYFRLCNRIYKPLQSSYTQEIYMDKIAEMAHYTKSLWDYIFYNPIPSSVMNELTNTDKDVLNFILHYGDISTKFYAAVEKIDEETSKKRITRFREHVSYRMLIWKKSHPEEAKLMPEVFSHIRNK